MDHLDLEIMMENKLSNLGVLIVEVLAKMLTDYLEKKLFTKIISQF